MQCKYILFFNLKVFHITHCPITNWASLKKDKNNWPDTRQEHFLYQIIISIVFCTLNFCIPFIIFPNTYLLQSDLYADRHPSMLWMNIEVRMHYSFRDGVFLWHFKCKSPSELNRWVPFGFLSSESPLQRNLKTKISTFLVEQLRLITCKTTLLMFYLVKRWRCLLPLTSSSTSICKEPSLIIMCLRS